MIYYIYSHPLFCDVPPTNIHTKNHQQQTQAGGVAGLVVDIVLFPIDTVKTRLQSERGFWKSGGFRGVYNGLAPAAVGSVPSAALFFCTYESVKRLLLDHTRPEYAPLVHMTSASLAETVNPRWCVCMFQLIPNVPCPRRSPALCACPSRS